jgi:hypothetical protein
MSPVVEKFNNYCIKINLVFLDILFFLSVLWKLLEQVKIMQLHVYDMSGLPSMLHNF